MLRQPQLTLLTVITCLLIDHFEQYNQTPSITYDKAIENGQVFGKHTNFEIDILNDWHYLLGNGRERRIGRDICTSRNNNNNNNNRQSVVRFSLYAVCISLI